MRMRSHLATRLLPESPAPCARNLDSVKPSPQQLSHRNPPGTRQPPHELIAETADEERRVAAAIER